MSDRPIGALRSLAEALSAELDAVRALADAVEGERAAVEHADAAALRAAAERVAERSRRLSDLARTRDAAVARLGLPAGSGMDSVVAHLRRSGLDPGPVEGVAAILRREAAEVTRRLGIVRRAADRLAAHLAGVRALVQSPGAATYGRRGRLASSDRALAIDVRH